MKIILAVILVAFCASPLWATTYYVNNTIAGASNTNAGTSPSLPWLTIAKAAATAVAGDTVTVVAGGSYNEEVVPANSGTSGNPITYSAGSGARPKVRRFNLANKSYITVNGFEFTNIGFTADTNPSITVTGTTGVQILNNYIHDTTSITVAIRGQTPIATSLKIGGNALANIGPAGDRHLAIEIQGNEVLIENNDISHVNDYIRVFGSRNVIRGNLLHDSYVADTQAAHIDGFQGFCAGGIAPNYTLLEGNIYRDNPDADSHFAIINSLASGGCTSTTVILRNNTLYRVGDAFYGDGDALGSASHHKVYNNTMVTGAIGTNEHSTLVMSGIDNAAVLNNIFVDAIVNSSPYEIYSHNGTGFVGDYNLTYLTTGSVSWDASMIGSEVHGVRNLNPLIVSTTDFGLQTGSPAIDAGGPLTTVAVTDSGSGTVLVVNDAHFFQDGWAGVTPDTIAVGTVGNVAAITAINYATNTVTLASGITRADGDPVWLKSNSTAVVLTGTAPDIGAHEGSPDVSNPPVPGASGVLISSNVGSTTATLNWTRATDDVTPQAQLQYAVYRSDSNNIGTVMTAEANGTLLFGYATNIATYGVVGLMPNSEVFLTVIVRDAGGHKAVYSTADVITEAVPAPTLVSITPTSGKRGTTLSLILTGTGFLPITGVSVSGTGVIPAPGTAIISATRMQINVIVSSTALLTTRTVTVTTAGGTSTSKSFTVQAATKKPPKKGNGASVNSGTVSGSSTSTGTVSAPTRRE